MRVKARIAEAVSADSHSDIGSRLVTDGTKCLLHRKLKKLKCFS
tara:strand:+ start:1056 stop:1187 length:132 start_codon:yes stop_codon:yes gene_type:complete